MKNYKVSFYKHETTSKGAKETYLGSIIINDYLPPDCHSLMAKAFRNAHTTLQVATGVTIEEYHE